jgi:hypothetical protein
MQYAIFSSLVTHLSAVVLTMATMVYRLRLQVEPVLRDLSSFAVLIPVEVGLL